MISRSTSVDSRESQPKSPEFSPCFASQPRKTRPESGQLLQPPAISYFHGQPAKPFPASQVIKGRHSPIAKTRLVSLLSSPLSHQIKAPTPFFSSIQGRGNINPAAMASLRILPAAAAAAILFFIVAAVATKAPDYVIQGRVYCDTCRAGFETNVTEYMKGNVASLNLWMQSFR